MLKLGAEMDDPLGLDDYVIARPAQFTLSVYYECMDVNGAKVLEARRSTFGNQFNIFDSQKKHVGAVHHKMLSLTTTFELMDGSKHIIGMAVRKAQFINNFENHFTLYDTAGNVLALAGGDYMNFNYLVQSPDGARKIAIITKNLSADFNQGILSMLTSAAMGAFRISIEDKDFSRLMLIEFTLAIDMLANMSNAGGGGVEPTINPGPMAPGGLSFKL